MLFDKKKFQVSVIGPSKDLHNKEKKNKISRSFL